jgi:hypothetical protein
VATGGGPHRRRTVGGPTVLPSFFFDPLRRLTFTTIRAKGAPT